MLSNLGPSLIALIALAACGGPSKPPAAPAPPPPPTPGEKPAAGEACQQAVDVLFAVTAAKEAPDIRARAAKVFVHRCEADRWSAEIRHCMVGIKAPEDSDKCEALLTPEQSRELRDELARELDAAGVKPQTESGRPTQPTKPSDGKAGAKAGPKADAAKAEEMKASEKKDEAKKSKGAPAPKPAPKAAKPGRADPCEGGE